MAGKGQRVCDMNKEEFVGFLEERFRKLPQLPRNRGSGDLPNSATDYDSDVYNFEYPNRGLALIFNNERFGLLSAPDDSTDNREGASFDETKLVESFGELGFHVFVLTDLTAWQMLLAAEKAPSLYSHEHADCFVCVVLSHGKEIVCDADENGIQMVDHIIQGVDNKHIRTRDIVWLFSDDNCPALKNKPRLFFIQACRGTKMDSGVVVKVPVAAGDNENTVPFLIRCDTAYAQEGGDGDSTEANIVSSCFPIFDLRWKKPSGKKLKINSIPLYQDCLIMYATPPGYYAWRRKTAGSWFILELCEFLQDKDMLKETSFVRGLAHVCGEVAITYESDTERTSTSNKKEMPIVDSMLIKDIYMTKKIITVPLHS